MILREGKYELVTASREDSREIKKLYDRIDYGGDIDLRFQRGEDPFKSFSDDGDGSVVVLFRIVETGEAIGMGACTFHTVFVNGELKRYGYLNGLKLLSEYRNTIRYIPESFKYMFDETKDRVELYGASILKQAENIQKIFLKRRSNMPYYEKQCVYTTFIFKKFSGTYGLKLESGNTEGLDEFYGSNLPRYNLSPSTRHLRGATDLDFITWRDNGKILASCAIYNNQDIKNYYLKAYSGILSVLHYFPSKLLGFPAFPKTGKIVNNINLSMLMFDAGVSISDRARFIKAATSFIEKCDVVTVGLTDTDSTYKAFDKIRHLKYNSYFYTINWGDAPDLSQRPIYLDMSFM